MLQLSTLKKKERKKRVHFGGHEEHKEKQQIKTVQTVVQATDLSSVIKNESFSHRWQG